MKKKRILAFDSKKIKTKTKEEFDKSKQRGKNRLKLKNLHESLKNIMSEWGD